MLRRAGLFAKLSLILFLGACATIERDGLRQAVLIQTDPPGAGVLVNGVEVAQAPAYVLINRARKPTFQLRTAEGIKTIPLRTNYRWRGSFLPNLVCISLMPACWLTDIFTGAAYDAEAPPVIAVRLAQVDVKSRKERPPVIGVAPPISDMAELSDAGGIALSELLAKEEADAKVLPYQQTLPVFTNYKFDFDNAPDERYPGRAKLYQELHLSSVVESVVEAQGEDLILKAIEKNVHSNKPVREFELTLAPSSDLENAYVSPHWWSRLLPNTLGIDFVSSGLRFNRGVEQYEMQPSGDDVWWAKGVRYLSTIDVFNTPPRRSDRASRWGLDFVPGIRLLRMKGKITGLTDQGGNTDQEFTRWWVSGGYGVEFSWQSGNHIVYMDIIPALYWNEISWSQQSVDHSYTGTGISTQAELGYAYHFGPNWIVRVFSRGQDEDSAGWNEILGDRLPPSAQPLSISNFLSGVTVAYRFGPKLSAKSWRRHHRSIARD